MPEAEWRRGLVRGGRLGEEWLPRAVVEAEAVVRAIVVARLARRPGMEDAAGVGGAVQAVVASHHGRAEDGTSIVVGRSGAVGLSPRGEKRGRHRAERERGRILRRLLLEKIGCGCVTHLLCVT